MLTSNTGIYGPYNPVRVTRAELAPDLELGRPQTGVQAPEDGDAMVRVTSSRSCPVEDARDHETPSRTNSPRHRFVDDDTYEDDQSCPHAPA